VDALDRNLEFMLVETKKKLVEIPEQATTISKTTMESGDRYHERTKIHEIQSIFTLSEVIEEGLE
jgi:hypothetical protein